MDEVMRAFLGRPLATSCIAILVAMSCDDYAAYRSAPAVDHGKDASDAADSPEDSRGASEDVTDSGDGGQTDSSDAPEDVTDSAGGDARQADSGDAASDASDASRDAADEPPTDEHVLWNDGRPGNAASILVCFTKEPHPEPNGAVACVEQVDSTRACNGDTFESYGTNAVELRLRLRALIKHHWELYGGLELYGWNECASEWLGLGNFIEITFVSSCPESQRDAAGRCSVPGFDPAPWNEVRGPIGRSSRATDVHIDWKALKDGRNDRAVVHAFGHALGFGHSSAATGDASSSGCSDLRTRDYDPSRGAPLTRFFAFTNPNGIMNPCLLRSEAPAALSTADVLGLQSWYGRKPDGMIVDDIGECLTPWYPDVKPYACRGGPEQTWRRDPASSTEQLRASYQGWVFCFDVPNGAVSDSKPTPIGYASCIADPRQSFSTIGMQWRALGNLCVRTANAVEGDGLETALCEETSSRWDFFHPGPDLGFEQIRLSGTSLCVSGRTAGAPGEPLTLATCNTTDERQQFFSRGRGVLEYGNGWKVGAPAGEPAPGIPLVLTGPFDTIYAPYDTQFHLTGTVQALGQCLTTQLQTNEGLPIAMEKCRPGAPEQLWHYYFGAPP